MRVQLGTPDGSRQRRMHGCLQSPALRRALADHWIAPLCFLLLIKRRATRHVSPRTSVCVREMPRGWRGPIRWAARSPSATKVRDHRLAGAWHSRRGVAAVALRPRRAPIRGSQLRPASACAVDHKRMWSAPLARLGPQGSGVEVDCANSPRRDVSLQRAGI